MPLLNYTTKVNVYATLGEIQGQLVAHGAKKCETRTDVAAKLLEWLSREAFKSQHFNAEWRNAQVHKYHLDGINQFCGTSFTTADMGLIYTHLGNGVSHQETLNFIQSGYDLDVLRRKEKKC